MGHGDGPPFSYKLVAGPASPVLCPGCPTQLRTTLGSPHCRSTSKDPDYVPEQGGEAGAAKQEARVEAGRGESIFLRGRPIKRPFSKHR